MKRKRLISLLLIVSVLFGLTSSFGVTAVSLESDYIFDSATGTITGYIGAGGDVVIPAVIGGVKVIAIGDGAIRNHSEITNISIQEGVEIIGNSAFADCFGITSIIIPDSINIIDETAFSNCRKLELINVSPNNNSYSSDEYGVLFNKDKTILIQYPFNSIHTTYIIPESVMTIKANSFTCNNLENIEIQQNVRNINTTFAFCMALKNITVSEKNQYYSTENGVLFNKDKSTLIRYVNNTLQSYSIPETVVNIEFGAFSYCSILQNINIHDNILNINVNSFINCFGLMSFNVSETNSIYSSDEYGILFNKDKSILIKYPPNNSHTSYIIPDSVIIIEQDAFISCNSLTEVTIPSSLTSIDNFKFCFQLTGIIIPESVVYISKYAFFGCENLTTIYGISGSYAQQFASDNGYTFISISNIPSRTYWTFDDKASALGWANIAVNDCVVGYEDGLMVINIKGADPYLHHRLTETEKFNAASFPYVKIKYKVVGAEETLSEFFWGSSIHLGPAVETCYGFILNGTDDWVEYIIKIQDNSFGTWEGLIDNFRIDPLEGRYSGKITGDEVVYVDYIAFFATEEEASVWQPSAPLTFGDYTYTVNSDNTTTTITGYKGSASIITIPDDINGYMVSVIGDYAFYDYTNLTDITIPNSVTNIGRMAFLNCRNLENAEIPDSVVNIGEWSFDACVSLKNVTISQNVIHIGEGVYNNCVGITNYTVSESNLYYSSDGYGVLFNKDKSRLLVYPSGNTRTSYMIPDSVTSIRDYAFNNSFNLISVTITDNVTSIGNITFINCTGMTNISIPESVTSISGSAFNGCRNLSVIYGKPGSFAEQYAAANGYLFFSNSSSPEADYSFNFETGTITDYSGHGGEVVIPTTIGGVNVTSIGASAFLDCVSLTSAVIIEGVAEIGDNAFDGCSNMAVIHIPASVTNISVTAFAGCTSLKIYGYAGSEAERYASEQNIPFIIIDVSSATSGIQEEDFRNVKFDVKKAYTAWTGDGVISDGEYYRIESKNTWFSCFSADGRNNNYAKNLMPEIYMSWDEDYIYWASVVTVKNHDCAWDDDPASMWNSGCVQINYSEPYQTEPLSRLEYGVALSSVTHNLLTTNWADPLGSGYVATDNNDFFIVNNNITLTYEVRTPWSAFLADPSVSAGDGIGACFVWSVGEGQDFIHTQLAQGCTGFGKNAENFAQLTLVEPIEIQVKQFIPNLDGVISEGEYPADSWFVLDKAAATACNGIWTGEMTDDLMAKYNFAWAIDGLYAAFVAVDNTPDPATSWDVHGEDGGPSADGFQFNTGIYNWTTIGAYADGTLSPRNHTGGGEEIDSLADIVIGRATREGNIFTVEAFIPWTKLLNYQVAQDSVIPMLFAYMDRDDGADNVSYKSMDVDLWDAADSNISLILTATTYDSSESDFSFNPLTGTITRYTGPGGDVIIPTTIDGISVKAIGYGAFYGCTNLTSLNIPDSVTTIGINAFVFCSGLTNINIPDSVTTIGGSAFAYCSGLTNFMIPDSVITIGNYAFAYCTGLISMVVQPGNSIYTSEDNCLIEIATKKLISGCKTSVIPNYVTDIGFYAFVGCTDLTEIIIPDSVTTIIEGAFADCTGLTSIYIPDGVIIIDERAFMRCGGIASYTVSSSNPNYSSDAYGVLFNKDKSIIMQYPAGNIQTSYTLPDSVTSIENFAFYDCNSLTNINIPDSVTIIGYNSFENCTSLTSINIPGNVTIIENYAFYNCSGLTSINIPASVTYIGDMVFVYCSGLTSIIVQPGNSIYMSEGNCLIETATNKLIYGCKTSVIPDFVTCIGFYAFGSCLDMTIINIPESVIAIDNGAFEYCSNLTSIYGVPGSYAEQYAIENGYTFISNVIIPENDFAFDSATGTITEYTGSGGDVVIPSTINEILVVAIGNFAFNNCKSLDNIIIPDSVTYIGDSVFNGCTSLKSVTLPTNINKISNSAFANCSNLINITIPNSVTNIEAAAFSGCKSLTNIIIPNGVTNIGEHAFSNCSSLTNINLPESVNNIDKYALYNCNSMASLTVSPLNQYYASDEYGVLFNKDKNILIQYPIGNIRTEYSIPDSVTNIDENAFVYGSNLIDVIIPVSVISIGTQAFSQCSSITNITIPSGTSYIGDYAFYGCNIEHFIVSPQNQFYSSDEYGVLFNKDKSTLIQYPKLSMETSYTIPDSVINISEHAFANCNNLTSITIPDSVSIIRYATFIECRNLIIILIPNSVTDIGGWSFEGCSSLISITIPESVISIGESAFRDCTMLTTIYGIPGSYAEQFAFENGYTFISNLPKRTSWTFDDRASALRWANVTVNNCDIGYEDGSMVININGDDPYLHHRLTETEKFDAASFPYVKIRYKVVGANETLSEFFWGSSVHPGPVAANNYQFYLDGSEEWVEYVEKIQDTSFGTWEGIIEHFRIDPIEGYASGRVSGNEVVYVDYIAFFTTKEEAINWQPNEALTYGDYTYTVNSDNTTATITGYKGNDSTITIPGDINGYAVSVIGDYAFSECSTLINVIISDSVTSIGEWAFYRCFGLESIDIPDSVTNIGGLAFYSCLNLIDITIPDSVTLIGEGAFFDCRSMTDISVGILNQHYSSDEYGVLFNYNKKHLIQYPAGNSRTCYTIPNSVDNIGAWAFDTSINLQSVTIPESVINIGEWAFGFCSSLQSVTIPDSVLYIGKSPFGNCANLTNINVSLLNQNYSSDELGILFDKNKSTLIQYPAGNESVIYTIPNSVTTIGEHAFCDCNNLFSVTIPASVTSIGNGAFINCANLKIRGYKGSEAESYAKNQIIPFLTILQGTVDIIGEVKENNTLYLDISKIKPVGATFTYEWRCGGVSVGNNDTYVIKSENIGKRITIIITGIGDYTGILTNGTSSIVIAGIETGSQTAIVNYPVDVFPEDTVLAVSFIAEDEITPEVAEAIKVGITEESATLIFAIEATSNDVIIQPDGHVKITLPIGDIEIENLVIIHITSNSVEKIYEYELNTSEKTITFEVSHFSYFVLGEGVIEPVIDITDVPKEIIVGQAVTLNGTVLPSTATNKQIIWNIKNAGTTGALITGSILSTTKTGILTVTATIVKGINKNTDYKQDFNILVRNGFEPVTDIINIPIEIIAGKELTLDGTVVPSFATNKAIIWSVKNAGITGATITDNILNTSAAGIVTITATIINGLTVNTDYKQDFTITVTNVPISVLINIKPTINLKNKGKIPVVVFGNSNLDVTSIKFNTVVFAGAPALDMGGSFEDMNDDGYLDVIFHFSTQELNLIFGDTEATLSGYTESNAFSGTGSVNIKK